MRFAGDWLNSPAYRFDERRDAFCFAIFGNQRSRMPHRVRLFTRSANLRLFVAPFCGVLGLGEAEKPYKSKKAVFLYVPMETCKSFWDSTALDGTE